MTSLSVMGLIEPPGGYEAEYIKFKGKDISRISGRNDGSYAEAVWR